MEQFIASTDRLCAEIAKLNTLLEQRLPVNHASEAPTVPPTPTTPPGSLYAKWLADNGDTVSEWVRAHGYEPGILEYLSAHGLLDIIKDSPEARTCSSSGPMVHAAKNGHLDVVKWFVSINRKQDIRECTYFAAEEGHLDILEYIHTEYPNFNLAFRLAEVAAIGGHLHIIQWFEDTIEELSGVPRAIAQRNAAVNGHVHVLRYLMTVRGTGVNQRILEIAASNGHLDVVQFVFIHDKSLVIDIPALIKAAESQPHITDWIRRMIE